MCLMSYANNKGADQPAHPRSLISAFVVRCLDSIISLDSIAEISRLQLASVAAQAGLCLAWSETHEGTFSRGAAHVFLLKCCMQREKHKKKLTFCNKTIWYIAAILSKFLLNAVVKLTLLWTTGPRFFKQNLTGAWQNQQSNMCAQRRLISAWAPPSPISKRCEHEET